MKKYVSKFMYNNLRNSMTKNRLSQHVQKIEHINWGWFGTLQCCSKETVSKMQLFSQESTKSYKRQTFFY